MSDETAEGFSAEERAAMKERAEELKPKRKSGKKQTPEEDEAEVLDRISELSGSDRVIAERIHELVAENAPDLAPKTWYGMPAYAKDGKVVFFFQAAGKFKTRYATLGFNDNANIDDGALWPTAFAITELTASGEKKIAQLIAQSIS